MADERELHFRPAPDSLDNALRPVEHPIPRTLYTATEWASIWKPRKFDSWVRSRLENLLLTSPSMIAEDKLKAGYYMFSATFACRGVNLLDDPGRTTAEQGEMYEVYDLGSRLAAQELLQGLPENTPLQPVAQRLLTQGLDAPLETHLTFYQYVASNAVYALLSRYRHAPYRS